MRRKHLICLLVCVALVAVAAIGGASWVSKSDAHPQAVADGWTWDDAASLAQSDT